ncbi:MAG: glycosyltransferase family 4 protein [Thermodesulfobacteriota bacterium]
MTDNFPPELNAPASRTFEHCREWVRAGEQVTVITCAPNFPQGRLYPGYRNSLVQREIREGIHVIRVWTYITANEGFARRIIDYLSFAFSSTMAAMFLEADVVLTTSPQFFTNFGGAGVRMLKRKPWVFELRDLWPESIRAVGAMQENWMLRPLESLELFFYHKANGIVALTEAFKQNLIARGIPGEKIKVIPNSADRNLFYPREKDAALLQDLGLWEKFVVGYIGTHGMAHGLDFIVRAAARVKDPSIHFLFVGDGSEKSQVASLARSMGLSNVTFLDPIPKEEVPHVFSVCNATLVPLKRRETFKTVLPSKIFEASAMQKPILLGVDGQARFLVERYGAGLFFEPENEEHFLQVLKKLRNDQKCYQSLVEGCNRLAGDFSRSKLAMDMLEFIKQISETNPSEIIPS